MSYIRTKDGIYEVEWNSNVEMWCDVKTHKGFILDSMISKKDYILADNLAELCDYVMMIVQGGTIPTVFKLPTIIEFRKRSIEFYYDEYQEDGKRDDNWFKLAIATDKGLIYVAKLNDKGELELI